MGESSRVPGPQLSPRAFGGIALAILLAGAALRVAMGFESFWLDEAWSWALAREARSALDVFTSFRHDNNHPLNTLYLYALRGVGDSLHWIVLRIPSLVAGVLSLALVLRLGLRFGRGAAGIALGLAAASFPLVSASAQARGYAAAILFGLLYVELSWGLAVRRAGLAAAVLAAVAALGMLSHPTFVYALAGAVAWTAVREHERGAGPVGALAGTARVHGAALLLAGGLGWALYAGLTIGGGMEYDRWVTLRQAIAQLLAFPRRGPLTWVATVVVAGLLGQGLRVLLRARDRAAAAFFGVCLVGAPAAVVVAADPKLLYARYLLATFPWAYLLAAIGLAALWERAGAARSLAGLAVAFVVASNLVHAGRVLAVGRNDYLDTLVWIDRHSTGPVIEIGSDNDFRNATVLRFYAPRIPSGRRIDYVRRNAWPPNGPEWYLRHDWQAGHDPATRIEPIAGLVYERVQSFAHGPGDGFQWFVYRRVGPAGR